jgi:hypothetical protein
LRCASNIAATAAFLALSAQTARACKPPSPEMLRGSHRLELRIVDTSRLPQSGDHNDCRFTAEVVRVLQAPPGSAPAVGERVPISAACGFPGQWRTTCGPAGRLEVPKLSVGAHLIALFSWGADASTKGTMVLNPFAFRLL